MLVPVVVSIATAALVVVAEVVAVLRRMPLLVPPLLVHVVEPLALLLVLLALARHLALLLLLRCLLLDLVARWQALLLLPELLIRNQTEQGVERHSPGCTHRRT